MRGGLTQVPLGKKSPGNGKREEGNKKGYPRKCIGGMIPNGKCEPGFRLAAGNYCSIALSRVYYYCSSSVFVSGLMTSSTAKQSKA